MGQTDQKSSLAEVKGIADYFRLAKKVESEISAMQPPKERTIRIALLSSFTIAGLKEVLLVKCRSENIFPQFYVGDYNQYNQEILDQSRGLYRFDPQLIILFIDTRTITGEQYFLPYQSSVQERKQWLQSKLKEILTLIQTMKEHSSAKILLHNFEVPWHSPLGILENKQEFGFRESIEALNAELRNALRNESQVFLLDYESFSSKTGKENLIDYKMYYLADMKLDPKKIPELCDTYLSYVKPMLSLARKCLVLDLDNVLWGGIIGEDGLEGIQLGPTPEGRPFLEFQKYLLSLYNRGVILAVNSSNNLDDAVNVFRNHPHMILKENHFASLQINWNDKISNMKAIAEEIDIGLDSLVFVDDNKGNREMVRKALSEVHVVELPDDPALYLKTLMEIDDFNSLQLTEEDKRRGKMYAEQRKRLEFQKVSTDITDYLRALETVVTIERASTFNIPRISQLTQKTNQFNTTTRRYLEEDVKRMANSDRFLVFSAKVEDKFGDNGITGAAIVEKAADKWRIDTFLLSCRVIGRKVEETLIAYIVNQAKRDSAKEVIGEFIPTKKNAPAKDFYRSSGFTLVGKDGDKETWQYDLGKGYEFPEFIKLIQS